MVDITYKTRLDRARAGQIANTEINNLIGKTVEGSAIGFGLPVVQGAGDNAVRLPAAGDTKIFAITVREQATDDDLFAVGDEARLMRQGVIWVVAGAAVSVGDPVHVVVADGTFKNAGGVAIVNARYETSGAAGELVQVRLGN